MNNDEKEIGNALVSKFMGYKKVWYEEEVSHQVGSGISRISHGFGRCSVWEHPTDNRKNFCYPEYDYNWNWLMPVLKKIQTIVEDYQNAHRPEEMITWTNEYGINSHSIFMGLRELKNIQAIFELTVNFIKWYNTK